MSISVMIDLETTDTSPTSIILSVGAVKFDPYSLDEPHTPLYLKPDVNEQSNMGRTTSESTLQWWAEQSEEAQQEAFSEDDRVEVNFLLDEINRYVVGADKIYANGPVFDITMIENLYRMCNRPVPWQYWQIRDARTIYDLGDDSAKKNNSSAHNSLADSFCQAIAVQTILTELKVKKK